MPHCRNGGMLHPPALETTGLSADSHRILGLANVRTDASGRVLDERVGR